MNIQVLYADTLFLANLVLNFLALSLTGSVMHVVHKKRRLFLASVLGGAYALVAVLCAFPGALHTVVGVLLSALLVLIAFGWCGRLGLFFRTFALFYFSVLLLGGGMEALFALLEETFGMRTDAVLRPADAVLVIGFSAYFILRFLARYLGGGELPHSVNVRIEHEGRSVTLSLLVDSGCLLSDPITGRGAILVSASSLGTVLPSEVISAAKARHVEIPQELSLAKRTRLLPLRGVGGEHLILAFRPDEVRLLTDGGTLDVWVGLYPSESTRFGGCRGLLPASLLYGREQTPSRRGMRIHGMKGGTKR